MCDISTINNERGITLVEAMIAFFLTFIAIAWLMPMQDMSIRTGFHADYLGRATYIMQAELEEREAQIMNPNNPPPAIGTTQKQVRASGLPAAVRGDALFTVATTITQVAGMPNAWVVNVRVTWPPLGPPNGITSSIIATRYPNF